MYDDAYRRQSGLDAEKSLLEKKPFWSYGASLGLLMYEYAMHARLI